MEDTRPSSTPPELGYGAKPKDYTPTMSPAEMFEKLAFEANAVYYDGPGFDVEAALDGDDLAIQVNNSFDIMDELLPTEVEKDAATVSLLSTLAYRVVEDKPNLFPNIEFLELKDWPIKYDVERIGDVNNGDDGLSIKYTDPASHVWACFRAAAWIIEGTDPDVALRAIWLPTRKRDPRTVLIIARAMWLLLASGQRKHIGFDEIRDNLFSKAPAGFLERISSSNLPVGCTDPRLWMGYGTAQDFAKLFYEKDLRGVFASLGLTFERETSEKLAVHRDYTQMPILCASFLRGFAIKKELPPPTKPDPGKHSIDQAVSFRHAKVYGPDGLHGITSKTLPFPAILPYLSRDECYTNLLGPLFEDDNISQLETDSDVETKGYSLV